MIFHLRSALILGLLLTTVGLGVAGCGETGAGENDNVVVNLSGMVWDARHNPVADATVIVDGISATTDNNGRFTVAGLSNEKYTIQVAAFGFASYSKQLDYTGAGNGDAYFETPILTDASPIPLTVGSSWTYNQSGTSGSSQVTITISHLVTYAGHEAADVGGTYYYADQNGEIFASNGSCSPDYLPYIPRLAVGETITMTTTCGTTNRTVTVSVLGQQSVTVPAGTFNAWKVDYNNNGTIDHIYVVPGVGEIEFQSPTTTQVLTSFSLK